MNAAILLCAAMLAADNSAQVQAKVLYGTADEKQHRADIELWISQAVAKIGSPLAQPYTNWIALTGKEQELYSSMQGGRIIKGKVSEKEGTFVVEINGFKIKPLKQTVVLKPGERKVVQLTDYPAPNNVFIALEAFISDKAKKRAEALKANAKAFRLELNYYGPEDKPFYRMIVSVPPVDSYRSRPFGRIMFVKEHEASRIIDHLARDGFLDNAVDLPSNAKIPPPTMPGYTMTVVAGDVSLYEDLGWGLPMVQRLDALRDVLPESGKKEMDFVLGRLSGFRRQWEAEAAQNQKASFKGWELYTWEEDGHNYFSLMIGTNRIKTNEEIAKSGVKGFEAVKPKLDELKKGESVFLHGRHLGDPAPGETAKEVADYCEKIGLKAQ